MDYKLIIEGIKKDDLGIKSQIVYTFNERDFSSLEKLYDYINNYSTKEVKYKYISILLSCLKKDKIYDNKMKINNNILFLEGEQTYIIEYLYNNGYIFSRKQIQSMSNTTLLNLNIEDIYEEVNFRISKNNIYITMLKDKMFRKYIKLLYEYKRVDILKILIDDYEFIKMYDKLRMSVLDLIKNTYNIEFREKILTYNNYLKYIKNNIDKVCDYLSKEEIEYLKEDVMIKNLLVSKGLRFDILDNISIKQVISNLDIFKLYPFKTINEFSTHYKEYKLDTNKEFIDMYMSKIDDIYEESKFLNILKYEYIDYILSKPIKDVQLLYLFLSVKKENRNKILSEDKYKSIIYSTKNKKFFSKLDDSIKLDIFLNQEHIMNYKDLVLNSKSTIIRKVIKKYKEEFEKNIYSFKKEELAIICSSYIGIKKDNILIDLLLNMNNNNYFSFYKDNITYFKDIMTNKVAIEKFVDSINRNNKNDFYDMLPYLSETEIDILNRFSTERHNYRALETIVRYLPGKNDFLDNQVFSEELVEYYLYHKELLTDEVINNMINYSNTDNEALVNNINDDMALILLDKKYINTINKELIRKILNKINDKSIITDNMISVSLDKDIYKVYKSLKAHNSEINYSIDYEFLNSNTVKIKSSILEYIVKYRDLQKYVLDILTVISLKDFYKLCTEIDKFYKEDYYHSIFRLLSLSITRSNRKQIGNIKNIYEENTDMKYLITYMFYHIPFDINVIKNSIIPVPKNYYDVVNYEEVFNQYLSNNVIGSKLNTYLLKHYKLTKEEVYYLIHHYSIDYPFIKELNHVYSVKEDNLDNLDIKTYSIYETYKNISDIMLEENNKYNYLLKKNINNLHSIENDINNKSIDIYLAKLNYKFFVIDINYKDSYDKWNKYLENVSRYINCTYFNRGNVDIKTGIFYGFTDLKKGSLVDIDEDNVYLSKYSYLNNSNPYRLPDYILIINKNKEDISLYSDALRIKKSFKKYKDLKIIVLSIEDLYKELVNTYKKSKYIHKLVPCISLYSSYRDILDIKELNKYVKEYIDSDKKREEVQEILTKYRVDEFDLNTK